MGPISGGSESPRQNVEHPANGKRHVEDADDDGEDALHGKGKHGGESTTGRGEGKESGAMVEWGTMTIRERRDNAARWAKSGDISSGNRATQLDRVLALIEAVRGQGVYDQISFDVLDALSALKAAGDIEKPTNGGE